LVLCRVRYARGQDEEPLSGHSERGLVAHGDSPENVLGIQQDTVIGNRHGCLRRSGDMQPRQEV
jgi:hypothetical protein